MEECMSGRIAALAASLVCALCAPAIALGGDVSVGSPAGATPQNHQNEPAVAIDANHPNIQVAGWNDFVDWAPCPQSDATQFGNCFDDADSGVGLTAVAFSFNSGRSWIQPAYGLDGRRLQSDDDVQRALRGDPHAALVLREHARVVRRPGGDGRADSRQ